MISKEVQLAYKFHRILIDVITEVVHIYVENKIADDFSETTEAFLKRNFNKNNFDPSYLKDARIKIEEFKRNNANRFPANLKLFDLNATIALAQNLFPAFKNLAIWGKKSIDLMKRDEAGCLHNLRQIRNQFYGHVNFYEMQEVLFFIFCLCVRKPSKMKLNEVEFEFFSNRLFR